jgi:hypothetical protein
MPVIAESPNERFFGSWAGQEIPIKRQRIKGTKESWALDEFTNKGIHRDHTFRLQLAERHMNRPLIRPGGLEAIDGQIGAFSDAANQQKGVTTRVVAAEELLQELVLLGGEQTGESFAAGAECPRGGSAERVQEAVPSSQFIEDAAQRDESVDVGCSRQRRHVRVQMAHPAEDLWLAAPAVQGVQVGITATEIGRRKDV